MSSAPGPASSQGSHDPFRPAAGEPTAKVASDGAAMQHERASDRPSADHATSTEHDAVKDTLQTFSEDKSGVVATVPPPDSGEQTTLQKRVKTFLVGKPRDLADSSVFQYVS